MELWFKEIETKDLHIGFRVRHVLHRERSEFQDIAILDTPSFGRMLVLDGIVQTTVNDEFFYHEMIVHVPLMSHPRPERILVIGGGDGGTVREVIKHSTVQHVDLVEIDGRVIDLCREYLPELSHGLDDPRVHIHVADALKFVKEVEPETYDVVIVDSSDPLGPAVGLFKQEFYEDVARSLKADGLMVAQTESPWLTPEVVRDIVAAVDAAFSRGDAYGQTHQDDRGGIQGGAHGEVHGEPNGEVHGGAHLYMSTVPIYSLGQWSFTIGTKGPNPRAPRRNVAHPVGAEHPAAADYPVDAEHSNEAEYPVPDGLRYYTPEIHRAAFTLPRFVEQLLEPKT